jgi:Poly (ADP-ribose) glycohydrolase (PARG)
MAKEKLNVQTKSVSELIEILQLCGQDRFDCSLLKALLDPESSNPRRYSDGDIARFFQQTLPGIKKLARNIDLMITKPLPFLTENESITLTQMQISALLANAFLCTFPTRCRRNELPADINFHKFVIHSDSNS